jgi:hypothetical protein
MANGRGKAPTLEVFENWNNGQKTLWIKVEIAAHNYTRYA